MDRHDILRMKADLDIKLAKYDEQIALLRAEVASSAEDVARWRRRYCEVQVYLEHYVEMLGHAMKLSEDRGDRLFAAATAAGGQPVVDALAATAAQIASEPVKFGDMDVEEIILPTFANLATSPDLQARVEAKLQDLRDIDAKAAAAVAAETKAHP